jgi:hypothetical protein
MATAPRVIEDIFALQRGQFNAESSAAVACAAAAPQCGQCLLPINIMAKHEGHATVASLDSQYLHCGESDETAAPQFGQFRVWASIDIGQLSTAKPEIATKNFRRRQGGTGVSPVSHHAQNARAT